jgi:hypothetical protein
MSRPKSCRGNATPAGTTRQRGRVPIADRDCSGDVLVADREDTAAETS